MTIWNFLKTVMIAVVVLAVFCGIAWYSSYSAAVMHSNSLGGGWFWIVLIIGFSMAGVVVEAWRELRITLKKKKSDRKKEQQKGRQQT